MRTRAESSPRIVDGAVSSPVSPVENALLRRVTRVCQGSQSQIRGSPRASTYRMDDGLSGQPGAMFVFFSNRLGCFGSLLVSAALTLVLLLILNVI